MKLLGPLVNICLIVPTECTVFIFTFIAFLQRVLVPCAPSLGRTIMPSYNKNQRDALFLKFILL
jgi:hypothetical protein